MDPQPAFDLTRSSAHDVVREAERRRLLRALGLPFTSALTLAECETRVAAGSAPEHATPSAGAPTERAPAPSGKTPRVAAPAIVPPTPSDVLTVGDPPLARRVGDTLELVLHVAPRTKKNHKAHHAQQSLAYRKYRNAVVAHLRSLVGPLALPLPAQRYNIEALFFTDNDAADTAGLMQGLADALQDAGVLVSDRWLWTWDGTDQWLEKAHARVELRITPRHARRPRTLGLG